jgi:hypothetical protein
MECYNLLASVNNDNNNNNKKQLRQWRRRQYDDDDYDDYDDDDEVPKTNVYGTGHVLRKSGNIKAQGYAIMCPKNCNRKTATLERWFVSGILL